MLLYLKNTFSKIHIFSKIKINLQKTLINYIFMLSNLILKYTKH